MPTEPRLEDLRHYAVVRSLFTPVTLPAAIRRLGFVQADPIRAPARAQDLTLRHRVKDYRAGDLERRYTRLAIDEDCLVNYGFLPSEHLTLMHPRQARKAWDAETERKAADVLAFVREHGAVHPRQVDQHFQHGRVKNYWGGSSNASTQLLDGMHYRGLLRVKRRDSGTRIYEAASHPPADDSPAGAVRRAATLIDLVVRKYAPLPAASLTYLLRLLGYGAPHLTAQIQAALRLAREHLASCRIDGTTWYWPADENPRSRRYAVDDRLRAAGPVRPRGLGPAPLHAALGLDLQVRGLHAAGATPVWLLRTADAMAGQGNRLGQRVSERRTPGARVRLCGGHSAQRRCVPPCAG